MGYQVLARKYRPQRFADVAGQDHVGLKRCGHFEGVLARINRASLEAALVQNHRQRIGNDAFIVNNQDLGFCVIFGHTLLIAKQERRKAFHSYGTQCMADKHRMRYDQLGKHMGRITLLTGALTTRFWPSPPSVSVTSGIMQDGAIASVAIRGGHTKPKKVATNWNNS